MSLGNYKKGEREIGTRQGGRKKKRREERRVRKQTSAGRRTSPEGPSGANLAKCEPQPSEATRGGVSHLARFGAAGKRAAGKMKILFLWSALRDP